MCACTQEWIGDQKRLLKSVYRGRETDPPQYQLASSNPSSPHMKQRGGGGQSHILELGLNLLLSLGHQPSGSQASRFRLELNQWHSVIHLANDTLCDLSHHDPMSTLIYYHHFLYFSRLSLQIFLFGRDQGRFLTVNFLLFLSCSSDLPYVCPTPAGSPVSCLPRMSTSAAFCRAEGPSCIVVQGLRWMLLSLQADSCAQYRVGARWVLWN